jgi:phosphoglycolate phosphatase
MICNALFFDLDGTLINSGRDIANSINLTRNHYNLQSLPEKTIISAIGDGVSVLVQRIFPEFAPEQLDETVNTFKMYYRQHLIDTTLPYNGVEETLIHFKNKKKAVISNKPYEATISILEKLKLASYFDIILGGDSTPLRKPDPYPLNQVIKEFNVSPQTVVMVGDGSTDIISGKAANVITCAVGYGLKPKEELIALNPDYMIQNILELQELFQ